MRHVKKLVLIAGLTTALVMGFQNCARAPFGPTGGSADSSSLGGTIIEPMQNPYALLTGEQVLKSMTNVTNLTAGGAAIPGAVTTEYNRRVGAFAIITDMKALSSPMMIGLTSLAGEICNQVIVKESAAGATRFLFTGVDFTKPASNIASVPNATFDTVVRGLARNFWGRNETVEELGIIQASKGEFLAANASATTASLMVYTCAAMLSSVDSFSY